MERKVVLRTDIGKIREENQDSMGMEVLGQDEYLLVVADGMGGYTGGAEASRLVVEGIREHIRSVSLDTVRAKPFKVMAQALSHANDMIKKVARENPDLKDMGSTCVCALVLGDDAYLLHVGDSRAYLLREGRIRQITEDHTVVQEMVRAGYVRVEDAPYHPSAGILTKCVGQMHSPQPEEDGPVRLHEGDVLLMCSDGLYGMLDDDEMARVVFREEPEAAAKILIDMANEVGGYDNITLLLYYHGQLPAQASTWTVEVGQPLYEEKHEREASTMTLPYIKSVDIDVMSRTPQRILWGAIILSGLLFMAAMIWYMLSFR